MQHIVNRIRAFQAAQAAMESIIRENGLTPAQYACLMAVNASGSLTMGHLCQATGAKGSTLTDTANRAERHGRITRARSLTDRRIVTVEITPKGQADLDRVNTALAPLFDCMPVEAMEFLVAMAEPVVQEAAVG